MPVRFGLHLPNSGVLTSEADLIAIARRAEALGFDRVWVYDHLFNPVELTTASQRTNPDYYNHADMPYYDALMTLAVVAGATTRIGLGTRVLLPVLRSPVTLAKQIATLAVLAGRDRLVLGVGAGWLVEEFDAVGISRDERFARLDEHVAVMRAIWKEGITEHRGEFYRHPAAGFHPIPARPIPVLVGGSGPVALRRVARWGDGWALPAIDDGLDAENDVRELLGRLAEACEREDRDPRSVRLVAGADLSADLGHFEMLAEVGIDDVDLMLTNPRELDLELAASFAADVLPRFASE
jgi:probable F420-dependent oxidoreductase